jgi:hypothetical protein
VHVTTSTNNFGSKVETEGSVFPSLGVVIPLDRFSLLTGFYVEKQGRAGFVETNTLVGAGSDGGDVTYQATYERETSVHSVPLIVSREFGGRLILSAGVVLAFCDMREETALDFLAGGYVDTDDIVDTHASGQAFAGAFLVDLDRVSMGALYRTGPDLDGSIENTGKFAGLWRAEPVSISSHEALKLGLLARPASWLSVEMDYDRNPWSRLSLESEALSNRLVERWALGVQYRGDYLWRGSRYPINLGYYRQPVDWEDLGPVAVPTGEITEEAYSVGLSVPLVEGRAAMDFAFEAGTRKASAGGDLDEKFYCLSVSVSAMEVWRRGLKR